MNEIISAMKERRSIRKFKPDMPKREDIEQIIEAGLYAANGRGAQSAIIIAVTDKELREYSKSWIKPKFTKTSPDEKEPKEFEPRGPQVEALYALNNSKIGCYTNN